jgi:hypothetical protein
MRERKTNSTLFYYFYSVNGTTPKGHCQKSDVSSSSSRRTKSPRATTTRRTSTRQSSLDRVAESPRNSPKQATDKRRGILPRLYNIQSSRDRSRSSSSSKCPSPEVGLQNTSTSRGVGGRSRRSSGGGGRSRRGDGAGGSGTREATSSSRVPKDDRVLQDSEESRTHYRVLMSWEADYLRGSKATRGPILYAMEKVREQLDSIEGVYTYTCMCVRV